MNHETKVGLVVGGAIAILLGAVVLIGKVRLGVSGYHLNVQFTFVNNLREDAPVKYAGGPTIGHVRGITVDKDLVNVRLWIDRRVRVRTDSEIWIFTTGMLGEQYVEINASPSGEAAFVPEGATVRGVDPVSIDATLIRLGKIVDALTPIFAKEEVAASVHSMVADLKAATGKIANVVDKHVGRMDQAFGDLEQFSRALGRMSSELEGLMDGLKVMTDPKSPESLRSALVKTNAALDRLHATAKTVDGMITKIDQGKGLLGTMIHDEALAADVKALVKKLRDQPITAKVKWF